MNDKNHSASDRHLDAPSEANRDKHVNFSDVKDETDSRFDKTSDRQKQWQEEVKNGEEEKKHSDADRSEALPMDDDDTLGIP